MAIEPNIIRQDISLSCAGELKDNTCTETFLQGNSDWTLVLTLKKKNSDGIIEIVEPSPLGRFIVYTADNGVIFGDDIPFTIFTDIDGLNKMLIKGNNLMTDRPGKNKILYETEDIDYTWPLTYHVTKSLIRPSAFDDIALVTEYALVDLSNVPESKLKPLIDDAVGLNYPTIDYLESNYLTSETINANFVSNTFLEANYLDSATLSLNYAEKEDAQMLKLTTDTGQGKAFNDTLDMETLESGVYYVSSAKPSNWDTAFGTVSGNGVLTFWNRGTAGIASFWNTGTYEYTLAFKRSAGVWNTKQVALSDVARALDFQILEVVNKQFEEQNARISVVEERLGITQTKNSVNYITSLSEEFKKQLEQLAIDSDMYEEETMSLEQIESEE